MFKIFYIDNCYYSSTAITILNILYPNPILNYITNLNKKYTQILCNTDNNKYTLDKDYKNVISTYNYTSYPKIFYKINKQTHFIGGASELKALIELANKLKIDPKYEITPQKYIDKNITCTLLIKLINNKNLDQIKLN